MVNANKIANSLTIVITAELEVKINASFLGMAMMMDQKKNPTNREFRTDIMAANLAPFALPAPSSFVARTLNKDITTWGVNAWRKKLEEFGYFKDIEQRRLFLS